MKRRKHMLRLESRDQKNLIFKCDNCPHRIMVLRSVLRLLLSGEYALPTSVTAEWVTCR